MNNNLEKKEDSSIQNSEKLISSLETLSTKIDDFNSKKSSFVRGIYIGVGTAIGASVIAAIALALLGLFLNSFEDVGFINFLTDWLNTGNVINGQNEQ
jgi:hypothetical protein